MKFNGVRGIYSFLSKNLILLLLSLPFVAHAFEPTPVITVSEEQQLVSSTESVDDLGMGLEIVWRTYEITLDGNYQRETTYLGESYSDEEVQALISNQPGGLYAVVLTVTNADGVSSSTHEHLIVDGKENRFFWKITKTGVKQFIKAVSRGDFDWAIPKKYQSGLKENLDWVLKNEAITTQTLTTGIRNGLMKAGMSYSKANDIAYMIVYVLV